MCYNSVIETKERNAISIKIIEKIIDFAKKENISHFDLAGGFGEPLLHPQFINLIKIIKDKISNSYIEINTNSILLKKEISEEIIRKNLIDSLNISINFINEEEYK